MVGVGDHGGGLIQPPPKVGTNDTNDCLSNSTSWGGYLSPPQLRLAQGPCGVVGVFFGWIGS